MKERIEAKKHIYQGLLINSILNNNIGISVPDFCNINNPVFCIYISRKHCCSCVKDIIKNYLGLLEVLPDSSVKILSDFNQATNKYLKAEFQIKYEFVSVSTHGISKSNCGYPCLFVYNDKTKSSDLFLFLPKNEPEFVKKYLNEVHKKWFEKI